MEDKKTLEGGGMKRIAFLLVVAAAVAGVVASTVPASGRADGQQLVEG
jgi:hypothetical protein